MRSLFSDTKLIRMPQLFFKCREKQRRWKDFGATIIIQISARTLKKTKNNLENRKETSTKYSNFKVRSLRLRS